MKTIMSAQSGTDHYNIYREKMGETLPIDMDERSLNSNACFGR